MIDAQQLLKDLLPLMRRLEDDLRERSQAVAELEEKLRSEWQLARQRERTAQTYEAWRDDYLSQAAAMWILGFVFVRFLEDNALVSPPRISGPGERLRLARDQHTLYFSAAPAAQRPRLSLLRLRECPCPHHPNGKVTFQVRRTPLDDPREKFLIVHGTASCGSGSRSRRRFEESSRNWLGPMPISDC